MTSHSAHAVSEREAIKYFAGLPSTARLVYRSGAPPVFNHKIVDASEDLGPKVVDCLDSKNVKFTTIDWVRFATGDGPPGPITLWVGVLPDSLTAEDAHSAACVCLALLGEFDIADVEVAFRTSIYTRSAGPKLLEPVDIFHPTVDVRTPLTPLLGLRIAPRNMPHVEGTGGFYFAEGDKLFLVTARHVLFPPNNDLHVRRNASAPRHDVLLLGTKAFDDIVASIEEKIGGHNRDFHQRQRTRRPLGTSKLEPTTEWKKLRDLVGEESKDSRVLGKLHGEVTSIWAGESQRVLGHLDSSKFDKHVFRGNVIELGTMHADIHTRRSVCMLDRLYGLRDYLTEEDMRHPNVFDRNGEECLMVFKSGSGSGLTLGSATGVFSYVREYFNDCTYRTSREWAILPHDQRSIDYDPAFTPKPGAFSAPGDSGAVIADGHRRFGGVITGGAGANPCDFDITYATPSFWLWSRIKAAFPDAHLGYFWWSFTAGRTACSILYC
ncbi:hypothetical protein C8T65DRAFT_709546 [Cerioporus squamosus]|nr:hypothetical protein C8T65DRAFT_709546 [Cerioporus squamosus]